MPPAVWKANKPKDQETAACTTCNVAGKQIAAEKETPAGATCSVEGEQAVETSRNTAKVRAIDC